ncbi:hypothetical protein GJ654_18665 [Rhodoblastus acidophilus]|uniref:Uncharacterized protein n=1 Tax=Rhodoblastus acidophilus TaxID=1074 RepID=A0A6N8DT60_RHOAC|nr:hypothetical protein [Rhodoblastus acidophilus]MCW2276351.1 lysophospholipase L1-like esterase [Rhodoblastus acidophilus]MTV33006.1 hypothetical protein [Rhodoblastus acidophilus]
MSHRMTQIPRDILNQIFARNLEATTAVCAIYGRIQDNPEIARVAAEDLTQAAEGLQALAQSLAAYLAPENSKLN